MSRIGSKGKIRARSITKAFSGAQRKLAEQRLNNIMKVWDMPKGGSKKNR